MRMSDWSSDVCSSDLALFAIQQTRRETGTIKHHLRLKNRKILGCRRRSHLYIFKMAQWRFSYCRSLLILSASVVRDRKSVVEGKSVYVRVDLGGRRIIKSQNRKQHRETHTASH